MWGERLRLGFDASTVFLWMAIRAISRLHFHSYGSADHAYAVPSASAEKGVDRAAERFGEAGRGVETHGRLPGFVLLDEVQRDAGYAGKRRLIEPSFGSQAFHPASDCLHVIAHVRPSIHR